MIVRSDGKTLYIFKEGMRFWVMLRNPSTKYNDYLIPYTNYKNLLAPLPLVFWSEE